MTKVFNFHTLEEKLQFLYETWFAFPLSYFRAWNLSFEDNNYYLPEKFV